MIITRTPLRISLLGGGTDYPVYFREYGGLVLGAAINRYSFITARQLPPYHDFKTRLAYSQIEVVQNATEIQHRAIKACVQHVFNDTDPGLEITCMADMPSRSGTGSSSSFVVGLLQALGALQGRFWSAHELMQKAIFVEQTMLGDTVGCQDQTFAAWGGFNILRFHKTGEIAVYPAPITCSNLQSLEQHLMLLYTKLPRSSSAVASTYVPSLGEKTAQLTALYRLTEEGIEATVKGDWYRLGKLLHNTWLIKRGLGAGVSTGKIDELYARAQVGGAVGGKITGAGGGGCLLLLLKEPSCRERVRALLSDCVPIDFRFDHDGSRIIYSDRGGIDV